MKHAVLPYRVKDVCFKNEIQNFQFGTRLPEAERCLYISDKTIVFSPLPKTCPKWQTNPFHGWSHFNLWRNLINVSTIWSGIGLHSLSLSVPWQAYGGTVCLRSWLRSYATTGGQVRALWGTNYRLFPTVYLLVLGSYNLDVFHIYFHEMYNIYFKINNDNRCNHLDIWSHLHI